MRYENQKGPGGKFCRGLVFRGSKAGLFLKAFGHGIGVAFVKEIFWGNFKIITDGQEFGHAGQGPAAGNALHVGAAVAQIEAHAVFGNPFFQA